jgi:hypothetical protein
MTWLKDKLPNPMSYIALSMSITLFLYGLYILGPFYVADPDTAIGILPQQWVTYLTGAIYIVPSTLTFLGLGSKRRILLLSGIFGMFLAYLFSLMLRLLTVGFVPGIWLFHLALVLISMICYLFVWGGNGR